LAAEPLSPERVGCGHGKRLKAKAMPRRGETPLPARFGLRLRLASCILLCLLPLVLVVLGMIHEQFEARYQDAVQLLQESAEQIAAREAETLMATRKVLAAVIATGVAAEPERGRCETELASLTRLRSGLAALAVLAPDGTLLCSSSGSRAPARVGDRPYWPEAVATGGTYLSDAVTSRIDGRTVLWSPSGRPATPPAGVRASSRRSSTPDRWRARCSRALPAARRRRCSSTVPAPCWRAPLTTALSAAASPTIRCSSGSGATPRTSSRRRA
jgi:hypothetical protein